jgi:hypothetical protein
MNAIDDVLDALLERTAAGRLTWNPTATVDEFVATVGDVSISIREISQGALFPTRHRMEIINSEGWAIDTLDSGEFPREGVSGTLANAEQTSKLRRLYQSARRSKFDVQSTLDKLVQDLQNT